MPFFSNVPLPEIAELQVMVSLLSIINDALLTTEALDMLPVVLDAPTCKTPAEIVNVPVCKFVPVSICVPFPIFVNARAAEPLSRTPEKVAEPPSTPKVNDPLPPL